MCLSNLTPCSGANVDEENGVGRTPLHECAEEGQAEILDLLLKMGRAGPAFRDQNDFSPYDIAFSKRNSEVSVSLQASRLLSNEQYPSFYLVACFLDSILRCFLNYKTTKYIILSHYP